MARGSKIVVLASAVLVVAVGVAAVWWLGERQERMLRLAALDLAETYVAHWNDGNWERLDTLVGNRSAAAGDAHRRTAEGLGATASAHEITHVEFDDPVRGDAIVEVGSSYELPAVGDWSHASELVLVYLEDRWVVDWTPEAIHPDLAAGQHLEAVRSWPGRAPILDRDGEPLSGSGALVVVGVEPRRVTDRDELAAALADHTSVTGAEVDQVLDRPDLRDDWFYTLTTLPRDRYDEVRDELYPVPGLVFREDEGRVSTAPEMAAVVGTVGEITAEQLEAWGEPYEEGDVVGQTGLERTLERRLAGSPGGEVQVVDDAGEVVHVLHTVDPDAPEPVMITLDPSVQQAASQALGSGGNPAALVAVDVGSGEVRAAVNRPAAGFDRALGGRYPPGSTFKVITAAAALTNGTQPADTVSCPQEAAVGGRRFRNAGGVALGAITFAEAFAESCNTAFVQVAVDLPDGALQVAAEQFGFNADYDLGLPAVGGAFPEHDDDVELAAAAIGQARVTATPLHMAGVAAAVARGAWLTPTMILPDEAPEPVELPEPVREHLPALMRGVVTAGTGANAALSDRAVYGKTGTAEYGAANPPDTHGWFIGFSGNLAFAVLVEDASSGGGVAAPVAADFLRGLPVD